MPIDVHPLVEHTNDQDMAVRYVVEHEVALVLMRSGRRLELGADAADRRMFCQEIEAAPQARIVPISLRLAEAPQE